MITQSRVMKTSNPSWCTSHKGTAFGHQVPSANLIDCLVFLLEPRNRRKTGKHKERICLPSLGCSRYPTRPSRDLRMPRMSKLVLGSGMDMHSGTDIQRLPDLAQGYKVCVCVIAFTPLSVLGSLLMTCVDELLINRYSIGRSKERQAKERNFGKVRQRDE